MFPAVRSGSVMSTGVTESRLVLFDVRSKEMACLPSSCRKRVLSSGTIRSDTDVLSSAKSVREGNEDQDAESEMTAKDVTTFGRAGRTSNIFTDEEEDSKVYMSVLWNGGKLGAAFYDTFTSEMRLQLDVVERDDFEYLRRLLHQVQPHFIITSSRQDQRLLKLLQRKEDEENAASTSPQVEVLPSMEFSLEVCKRRVVGLANLPGMPSHFTDDERAIYSASLLPMDSSNTIRCLGVLCKYLDKHRVNVELETSDVRVPILGVKAFSLDDVMIIDDNTLSALQVFLKEYHPSAYKASSGKEGLSLFGICNRTRTTIGSRRLRTWFLRPLRDIGVLQQRLDAVEFLASTGHVDVTQSLIDCLRHVKNVPRILSRMVSAHASVGDWQSLYKTACNAIYIGDATRSLPQKIDIFRKITSTFSDDLHRIASLINKIVDFEESKSQNRFVVKQGVDEELDRKKQTYNNLPDLMTTVARDELDKFGAEIEECAVVYLPQLGYLLAVPCTARMKEAQDFEIDGLEFVFWNDNTAHYKSDKTKELDARLGDTQCEITDQETAIMHKLQSVILEHSSVLLDVMEYAAELDCLIAFASTAKESNYVKPVLTEDSVLDVKGGRHPLQELCVNPFIPNDIAFNGTSGQMKILTGPNASGKSVYLKQVALIVYMAHIGCFVPAETAVIGITDRIYSRVHTRESVSVNLSTFMIDLNQVSLALRCCTQRSLVIVDEFGKGTANVDGLALLGSSLRYWLRMQRRCPKLLVSTHFHSLIQQQLLPDSPQLQYQTMEVMPNNDDLVFLYQLKDGHTSSSYASHIAAVANVPTELIKRGQEVTELFRRGRPIHRIDTASTETRSKKYAAIVSRFLDLDLEKDDVGGFLNQFVLPTADSME